MNNEKTLEKNIVINMENVSTNKASLLDINKLKECSKNRRYDSEIKDCLKKLATIGSRNSKEDIDEKIALYKRLKGICGLKLDNELCEMDKMSSVNSGEVEKSYMIKKSNHIKQLVSMMSVYDKHIDYLDSLK